MVLGLDRKVCHAGTHLNRNLMRNVNNFLEISMNDMYFYILNFLYFNFFG